MKPGKAMQTTREECGLSRKEVAEMLKCTVNSIWKIENEKTQPKQSTIIAFCFATKCPLARFYILALEPLDFATWD